ncbi:MAG TPA: YccF domain-containing protein [Erysipelothrix sp.]|nr:YccF domain-containing protein [Erysipelothrix sp.]
MRSIGNLLWFIFGGLWQGLSWFIIGLLWSVTIIGLPIGLQCFKFSKFTLFPFGKQVIYGPLGFSTLINVLWLFFGGLPLAIAAITNGLVLCITIVGIPFGLQCFKFAKLALFPFGAKIVKA